jgi:hypothetical protein
MNTHVHLHLTRITSTLHEYPCTFTSDKNNGYFTWIPMYIYDSTTLNFILMRNVSDQSCRQNQNAYFFSSVPIWGKCAIYEIIWKNVVGPNRPQMTIRPMRVTCRTTEGAKNCLFSFLSFHTCGCDYKHIFITCNHNMSYLLLLHGNSGYANASQCYVLLTLPVLFQMVWLLHR